MNEKLIKRINEKGKELAQTKLKLYKLQKDFEKCVEELNRCNKKFERMKNTNLLLRKENNELCKKFKDEFEKLQLENSKLTKQIETVKRNNDTQSDEESNGISLYSSDSERSLDEKPTKEDDKFLFGTYERDHDSDYDPQQDL